MMLMKQARAFGVGVVLSTQNPVDIDYKAISNAGTWMIGRLQTERDKQRLLDGMSAAAGGVDISARSATRSPALGKREFVLRRASKDEPEIFTTRWAMSYLRGPLSRDQIETLMAAGHGATARRPRPRQAGDHGSRLRRPGLAAAAPPRSAAGATPTSTPVMPEVADGIAVRYVDVAAPWLAAVGGIGRPALALEAAVVARVRLRYDDDKADLVADEEYETVLFPLTEHADVTRAIAVDYDDRDLRPEPHRPGRLPPHRRADRRQDVLDPAASGTSSTISCAAAPCEISANRRSSCSRGRARRPRRSATAVPPAADELADAEAAKLRDKYEDKGDKLAGPDRRGRGPGRRARGGAQGPPLPGDPVDGRLDPRRSVRRQAGHPRAGQEGARRTRWRRRSAVAHGDRRRAARRRREQGRVAARRPDELEAELAEEIGRDRSSWAAKAADDHHARGHAGAHRRQRRPTRPGLGAGRLTPRRSVRATVPPRPVPVATTSSIDCCCERSSLRPAPGPGVELASIGRSFEGRDIWLVTVTDARDRARTTRSRRCGSTPTSMPPS